ncbi:orotidine 5'-phosphate decarboxylase / HUMPS family protein [Paenibacillus wulumuqiensis]|uniref:orotidine 5'-phosphate decarboxylase / HUMPS family protein n=1 Tax=Paenibacillus wulumuqiensis TaxID=1567107 RepID=UPI000697874C|nr:orotidine 5'-phosphate decarboxylase / HUMPS family protein [Paenibacillus wulumuqiensis]
MSKLEIGKTSFTNTSSKVNLGNSNNAKPNASTDNSTNLHAGTDAADGLDAAQPVRIQLALDRMTIEQAVDMAHQVQDAVEWIEVGTSLIKEFGMDSVRRMKEAFPDKVIVADIKTIDNAKYEFELCFRAGADVATVMAAAPDATLDLCMQTAQAHGGTVMIDLLNVSPQRTMELQRYTEAVLCQHVSKDQQEHTGQLLGKGVQEYQQEHTGQALAKGVQERIGQALGEEVQEHRQKVAGTESKMSQDIALAARPSIAAAGGITLETLPTILQAQPSVVIVGSAITKADDPARAARDIRSHINEVMQNMPKGVHTHD